MLSELFIENVAVIENARVRFTSGLNILTGETGAGKSILIDSINAILGYRTSREIVRTGSDRAVIWAEFDDIGSNITAMLNSLGYDKQDTLIVFREIMSDGGSRFRINQKPATAATVRELCSALINIHGQHDNQDLLNPEQHIHVLDRFAGLSNETSLLSELYKKVGKYKRDIDALSIDDSQKERQADLLRYQIQEIESANIFIGEDEQLISKRNAIRDSEKILQTLNKTQLLLNGDDEAKGILSESYDVLVSLGDISEYSEDYSLIYKMMNEQYYAISDIAEQIKNYLTSFEYDTSQLFEIEERLDLLFRLKRKYGDTIEKIFEFLSNSKAQLDSIITSDQQREILEKEYYNLLDILNKNSIELSVKREKNIMKFEKEVLSELSYLNMENSEFIVSREKVDVGLTGIDKIEFHISTNVGEPPKPLSRIASGGELSRIMLAIKNAMAEKDNIGTLIFDEIDAGISGNSAYKIGKKLNQSAVSRQTICVTHSAQIASFADNHLLISKSVINERTYTSVKTLDLHEREYELARIISGDNISEISLRNAGEMLVVAKENKAEE